MGSLLSNDWAVYKVRGGEGWIITTVNRNYLNLLRRLMHVDNNFIQFEYINAHLLKSLARMHVINST